MGGWFHTFGKTFPKKTFCFQIHGDFSHDDFLGEKFSLRTTMHFRQFNDDDDKDERLLHYGKGIQTDEAQFQSVF